MEGKGNVVELDRWRQALVTDCVLGADQGGIRKGDVGDGVGEETCLFVLESLIHFFSGNSGEWVKKLEN